jgi:hypothetical protein
MQCFVVDDSNYGSTLEGAIRPLLGKVPFEVWNTKPEYRVHVDFCDWRGQCVDVIARFDGDGTMTLLDPKAVLRGIVQPEFVSNSWDAVPGVLRRLAEEQDKAWAERLKEKYAKKGAAT